MGDKKKVPKIRFPEFTDEWEPCKLGDETIEILAGGDIDKDKVVKNGKYPIYANTLVNDGIVGYYNDYYRVKAPAVSVTGRGEVGHAQARMTDFTPVVRLLAIRSDHDCYFLENAINTQRIIIESTGVPQLTVPQLSSYDIFFPKKLEEEQKIGEYFHSIDNLINLHKHKLDHLKLLKKSMLQKMFPRNGAKQPEVRFPGFTDDWEQRKFDYVFNFAIPNNTLSRAELNYEYGSVKNIHYGDILIKYGAIVDVKKDYIPFVTGKTSKELKATLLQDGDIVIADTAEDETTGKACEICNSQGVEVVAGLHTIAYRPGIKMALGYLGYYLNSNAYHYQLLPLMQGIKVLSLSRTNIQKTNVSYPKDSDEQELIAGYFRNLDNLIALYQRKVEHLTLFKKGMSQKMFV